MNKFLLTIFVIFTALVTSAASVNRPFAPKGELWLSELGVECDGSTTATTSSVTAAATSLTLSSPNTTFTAGRDIWIVGAGSSAAIPYTGKITSKTGDVITLSPPIGTTVSGTVTVYHDETRILNTLINDVSGISHLGWQIRLPQGVCYYDFLVYPDQRWYNGMGSSWDGVDALNLDAGTTLRQLPRTTHFGASSAAFGRSLTGTATSTSATVLTDSARSANPDVFPVWAIGRRVANLTDGSSCIATGQNDTTVTCSAGLTGGSDNTFTSGDLYMVFTLGKGSNSTAVDLNITNMIFDGNFTEQTVYQQPCLVFNSPHSMVMFNRFTYCSKQHIYFGDVGLRYTNLNADADASATTTTFTEPDAAWITTGTGEFASNTAVGTNPYGGSTILFKLIDSQWNEWTIVSNTATILTLTSNGKTPAIVGRYIIVREQSGSLAETRFEFNIFQKALGIGLQVSGHDAAGTRATDGYIQFNTFKGLAYGQVQIGGQGGGWFVNYNHVSGACVDSLVVTVMMNTQVSGNYIDNLGSCPTWAAGATTAMGDKIVPITLNGHMYTARTFTGSAPYTTGGSEPNWTTCATPKSICVDGEVNWEEDGLHTGSAHGIRASANTNVNAGSICDNEIYRSSLIPHIGINHIGIKFTSDGGTPIVDICDNDFEYTRSTTLNGRIYGIMLNVTTGTDLEAHVSGNTFAGGRSKLYIIPGPVGSKTIISDNSKNYAPYVKPLIASHTGATSALVLTTTGASRTYVADEFIGGLLTNVDDGSSCTVTDNSTTTITCDSAGLYGGTDNDFDSGELINVNMLGTYKVGFKLTNTSSTNVGSDWITTTFGTMGTLGTVNATLVDSTHVTVSDPHRSGLYIGAYIRIGGGSTIRVTDIVNDTVSVSFGGATGVVTFVNPIFMITGFPNFHYESRDIPEDFLGGSNGVGEVGKWGWLYSGLGATFDSIDSVANHPGIRRLSTDAVATHYAVACIGAVNNDCTDTGSNDIFDLSGEYNWGFVFRIGNAPSTTVGPDYRCGVWNPSAAFQPPTTGIYFESLNGDTSWYAVVRNGGTQTRTPLGPGVDAGHWFYANFYKTASGVLMAMEDLTEPERFATSMTTVNVPTSGSVSPFCWVNSGTGATVEYIDMDLVDGPNLQGLTR